MHNPTIRIVRKAAGPITLDDEEGVELLLPAERRLCEHLRIPPHPYMAIKATILKEYARLDGHMRRRQARELIKIDVNKTSRIYDFFVEMGWIKPPPPL